ncbi:MAG: hypothetical protein BGO01_13235 [Armatimonadetes bacterium 55-13]|nr:MAG: hypothetical protein BGO01_13235 [Armatimonadetes bacterium 55-13]
MGAMSLICLALAMTAGDAYPLEKFDLSAMTQGWGSPQVNRSVDSNPLKVAGQTFTTGVGTHAASEIQLDLKGKGERFSAMVGVDDEVEGKGTVSFEVVGDGKKLYDSGIMKGNQAAKRVDVALKGVKKLVLRVKDGGDGIDYDHADWGAATVLMMAGAPKPTVAKVPVEPPIKIAMGVPERAWIHGPRVMGCSPGKPFLFRVPATGKGPLKYTVVKGDLPEGVHLSETRGILEGSVKTKGSYTFTIQVAGAKGSDTREYTIHADGRLALTPPLGWNSWNVWGTHVDADKVRAAADSFVKEGLADFGFQYVNIDDGWEDKRDSNGKLHTNEKFGDMKALSDYVHSHGLKLGIYSSPGTLTCAGYAGSWMHEKDDAESYAEWGIDYLKYDWCSYGQIEPRPDLRAMQKPYSLMYSYLEGSSRDIVYSLCQYGMGDVYKWGGRVGGNLWRTTGDITDTWQSMTSIGFQHSIRSPYAGPGGWNDPDMLVVGYLGWGPSPRPTRLTPNEQITHITLWAMLGAPFLIGCDLTRLDAFTKALLCNHEVIEIDQDPLGKCAVQKSATKDGLEVWSRPLWDGSTAVALFNRSSDRATVTATWKDLGLSGSHKVMDVWQMKWTGTANGSVSASVPAHGAMLFKLAK